MDETGYQDTAPATLTVTLASGRPWAMPIDVAKSILEGIARAHPRVFGDHLQEALMGEMPKRARARES